MRRETRDELLLGFLAINAMLRKELRGLKRTLRQRLGEAKYNPNWAIQPRAPRGTQIGGQWIGGGTPKQMPASTEPPRRTPPPSPPQRLPTAANDNALSAANNNLPLVRLSVSSGLMAALTLPLPLYGDTPRPRIQARQITNDLFLVVYETSGERRASFQRQVPTRDSVTVFGIQTGLLTESMGYETLPVEVSLEGDQAIFSGGALAAAYGRHISGITWSPSATSSQIVPITTEEQRLAHNLREMHATPDQIAIAIQQFRNSEAEGEPFTAALRESGVRPGRVRDIRRALRFQRSVVPYVPPTSGPLVDMFPGLSTAQGGQSLYALDAVEKPITELDYAQQAEALVQEIGAIDPGYRSPSLQISARTTAERSDHLDVLRLERAALLWRRRQEIESLQVEMIRFVQRRVDLQHPISEARFEAGLLEGLQAAAVGNDIDAMVRQDIHDLLARLNVREDDIIAVNRNVPVRSGEARPDLRIGNIFIDMTLQDKNARTDQVIDFFEAQIAPTYVIIIRPRRRGFSSLITPPQRRYARRR